MRKIFRLCMKFVDEENEDREMRRYGLSRWQVDARESNNAATPEV
jgi:hypothetical protein